MRLRPSRPSPMSLHVIALSLASSARDGLPIRGSPPGRESGARRALSCSPARRRRKLIGFLRRERRFDVVSYIVPLATMYIVPLATISSLGHNELAPYFKLPPNTLLESYRIVFLVMWFLCLTRCQNWDYDSGDVVLVSLMVGICHWVL